MLFKDFLFLALVAILFCGLSGLRIFGRGYLEKQSCEIMLDLD